MNRRSSFTDIVDVIKCLDIHESTAIKAVANGDANEAMQKIAMKAIVEKVCRTYSDTYDPHSERESNRMQGQRFVGLCLVDVIESDPIHLKELKEK